MSRSVRSTRRGRAAFLNVLELLETRRLLAATASFTGGTYTENFDALISSSSYAPSGTGPFDSSNYTNGSPPSGASPLDGWQYAVNTGTANKLFADPGSSGTGAAYSYGIAGTNPVTDRAFGAVASGSGAESLGVVLVNNSGATINSFTVSFDSELWHRGSVTPVSSDPNALAFDYKVGTGLTFTNEPYASDAAAGYLRDTNLDAIMPPGNLSAAGAVDGNATGNHTARSDTLTGLNWGVGQTLVLRWNDHDDTGTDDGIAIDNVSMSVPVVLQPGTISLSSSAYSGQEGTNSSIIFTVQRQGGADGAATVDFAIPATGSATQGVDYLTPSISSDGTTYTPVNAYNGTIHFANQQNVAYISVPIANDSAAELAESFSLNLSNVTVAAAGTQLSATGTIYDNDGTAPTGILLNELSVDPAGTDNPEEYVELLNSAGATKSLNDIYFVSVEGDAPSQPGNITYSYGFNGNLNANQLALLDASTGPAAPSGTVGFNDDANFTFGGGILQNGTNSFLLVYSQVPLKTGTDLDPNVTTSPANSTGPATSTLSALPPGAIVLDAVGWHDNSTNIQPGTIYGSKDGSSIADLSISGTHTGAATRIPGDNNSIDSSQWYYGTLAGTSNTGVSYDANHVSSNFPAGGQLTPGLANSFSTSTSGQVQFTGSTFAVTEHDGNAVLSIPRVSGSTDAISVDYMITDGTAIHGTDYNYPGGVASGTLTWTNGDNSTKTITIPIIDVPGIQATRTFTVTLSNGKNLDHPGSNLPIVGPNTVETVKIADDDTKFLISEILINPPAEIGNTGGADISQEYFEIQGTPGQTLQSAYFASVEGDAVTGVGDVTYVFNLSGVTVGKDGLILVKGAANTLLTTASPDTTVVTDPNLDVTNGALQNGTNTWMLVLSANAITTSSVLGDLNGNLTMPFGATEVDGVGVFDPTNGGTQYTGTAELPQFDGNNVGVPQAVARMTSFASLSDSSNYNNLNAWYYGNIVSSATTDDRLTFATTSTRVDGGGNTITYTGSAYIPVGGGVAQITGARLTPGEVNFGSPNGLTAPTLDTLNGSPDAGFQYNTPVPQVYLDFSANMSGNPSGGLVLGNNTMLVNDSNGGAAVTYGNLTLTPNATTAAGANGPSPAALATGYAETITFNGYTNQSLPDGWYTLTVNAGTADDFGGVTSGLITLKFFSLAGDANHDGIVNTLDFNALATNFGHAGTFSQGNFNYAGTVDSSDFDVFAANYGKVLGADPNPAPVPDAAPSSSTPASSLAASAGSLFSNTPIDKSLAGDLLN